MTYQISLPHTTEGIRERHKIVAEIAELPEGTEMAGGPLWRALVRGLDGYEMDLELYAELFGAAAYAVSSPERKATYSLEVIDALRRRTGRWDINSATDLLDDALGVVDTLPESARKDRLLGLGNYHAGLVFRMAGDYERAADCQIVSAALEMKAGNPGKAATSLFVANVERVSSAFMVNRSDQVRRALAALRQSYSVLTEFLGEGDNPWRESEGPCHLLQAHWLGNVDLPNEETYLGMLLGSKKTSPLWHDTFDKTFVSYHNHDWDGVVEAADEVVRDHHAYASSSTADAICLNLLMKARAFASMRKLEEAFETFGEVVFYKEHHGGQFVKAVAGHEIRTLTTV